eukprot:GEMP01028159.1.p1 GENE.GEMP01028159.1~~GEMP01028159.1.p1  ORF type:complete len:505 (+),score=120.06 GEMP01028159.1:351-1865(+)
MTPVRTPRYPLRLQPSFPDSRLHFNGIMLDYPPSPLSPATTECGIFSPARDSNDWAPPYSGAEEWAEPCPVWWSEWAERPAYPAACNGCKETPPIHPSWAWCPGAPPRGWKAPPDFVAWWNSWRASPDFIAWWNSWNAPPNFVAWWNSWLRPRQQDHQHSRAREWEQELRDTTARITDSASGNNSSTTRATHLKRIIRSDLRRLTDSKAAGTRDRTAVANPRKTLRSGTSAATSIKTEFRARSPGPDGFYSAEEDTGWEDLDLLVPKDPKRVFPNWWKRRAQRLADGPGYYQEGYGPFYPRTGAEYWSPRFGNAQMQRLAQEIEQLSDGLSKLATAQGGLLARSESGESRTSRGGPSPRPFVLEHEPGDIVRIPYVKPTPPADSEIVNGDADPAYWNRFTFNRLNQIREPQSDQPFQIRARTAARKLEYERSLDSADLRQRRQEQTAHEWGQRESPPQSTARSTAGGMERQRDEVGLAGRYALGESGAGKSRQSLFLESRFGRR